MRLPPLLQRAEVFPAVKFPHSIDAFIDIDEVRDGLRVAEAVIDWLGLAEFVPDNDGVAVAESEPEADIDGVTDCDVDSEGVGEADRVVV